MLYFTYNATIDPSLMSRIAPGAEFRFIAHLPEWRLMWTIPNRDGGLPSVRPEPGNTVWGAVFSVPDDEATAIHTREKEEGRNPTKAQAMDREGRRHHVVVHVNAGTDNGEYAPERGYLESMVAGSRHWKLPAGWVANLAERLEGV